MAAITLTAKRQATFPVKVCDELGLRPGDQVELERAVVGGEAVWVLRPAAQPDWSWFGGAKRWASGRSHDLGVIRSAIDKAWARGRRP